VRGVSTDRVRNKVVRTIAGNKLFHPGETVVVAVSGGADSTALLHVLASLAHLRLRLIVAHVHHGLRGAEADADVLFVEQLAGHYGIPVEITWADVRQVSRQRKVSLEEAGRLVRYAWFDEIASKWQADSVALGHHADDQAETFLLRLLRGAGTTGLAAMRFRTETNYVRPLLALTRAEILCYLQGRGLPFRHDASNDDTIFLRNRIRHECLPVLRTFNPAITACLNTTAELLAADEAVLESLTERVFGQCAHVSHDRVQLQLPLVRQELPGLRLRLFRRAIQLVKGDLRRIAAVHVQAIDALTASVQGHGALSLPDGVLVMREGATLVFSSPRVCSYVAAWQMEIPGPGRYRTPAGMVLVIELTEPPADWKTVPRTTAYFGPATAPFPWTLRTFRPGDRFRPFGMSGTRKVKDFFIDKKISVAERRSIPLLFSGGELLWVCGLRVSEKGRVLEPLARVLRVEIPEITT
jgi:tRNA(Ile)-lysidine synthase